MSGNQQQNAAATASQPAWTASEYEAALAHLYKLQKQVRCEADINRLDFD